MQNKFLNTLLVFAIVTGAASVGADMVVLKSGEMFLTPRAWKENGIVNYVKDGQVVRVDEKEVERLIQSPVPVEEKPPPGQRPAPDPQAPPTGPVAGQTLLPPAPTDDDTGYLNLRWGQPLSQIEGLDHIGTDPAYGGVAQYSKRVREKRFGRASVDDIVYGFWQEGLYTIVVQTSNFLDFRDLKAEAFRRFGAGAQRRDDVEKIYWVDKSSDRLLSYDYESDTGFLWMRSRVLHEKVRARYPE